MGGTRTERVEMCIVGAGITGLNALFVASKYLRKGQRVALVDRRPRVGGMWNDTYDYVRLHQAHPLFTAGNIKWDWDKDPLHLATKPEVLGHLQHCLDVLEARVDVREFFGWSYLSHEEADGVVRTTIEREGEQVVLESRKLVKAYGYDVETNPPLALSSSRIRSVSPDSCDVRKGEIAASDAPVWVIGGGKTGMDTAHTLITGNPGREVNLVAGSGTLFSDREIMYPRNRWTRGTRPNAAIGIFRTFDGSNEADFYAAIDRLFGVSVTPTTANWLSGILSRTEAETIKGGLAATLMDHLVDVVDDGDGVRMQLRSGASLDVTPGSWFVNCTGYLLKNPSPYEPFVSASGNVASANQRSATTLYPAHAGFFLTHLLLRDKLHRLPLYEVDLLELRKHSHIAAGAGLIAMVHNLAVTMDALPPSVLLSQWGTDFDRIYPAPRRLWGVLKFTITHRRDRRFTQRALDTLRERYGVRCGPLILESELEAAG